MNGRTKRRLLLALRLRKLNLVRAAPWAVSWSDLIKRAYDESAERVLVACLLEQSDKIQREIARKATRH